MPRAVAIVLAAGAGERLGAGEPKAFLEIAGRSILHLAAAAAAACPDIEALVVVAPPGHERRAGDEVDRAKPVSVVAGGDSRQASVSAGLAAVPVGIDVVVCHDAARPFASSELFSLVVRASSEPGVDGAVPVLPVSDTVKRVVDGVVLGTEPREELGLAQTPQAFGTPFLRDAHDRAGSAALTFTDDAALLEWFGGRVVAVRGEESNFKITTPFDLALAERMLEREPRG